MSDIDKIARLITDDPDIFTGSVNEAWGRSETVHFGWTAEEVELPHVMLAIEYEGTAKIDPGDKGSWDTPPSGDSVEVSSLQVRSVATDREERAPSPEEAKLAEDHFYRHIADSEEFYEYILGQGRGHEREEGRFQHDEQRRGNMGRGGL